MITEIIFLLVLYSRDSHVTEALETVKESVLFIDQAHVIDGPDYSHVGDEAA